MITNSLKKAQNKYNKKIKAVSLRFRKSEIDLYNYIKQKPSMNNYIINLIKKDKNKHE